MSNNSYRDLVQIFILVLLAANLAITTALWLERDGEPTEAFESSDELPEFATSEELNRIAEEIQGLFNAGDYENMYALFDAEARLQFSKEDLVREIGKLKSFLGVVEDFAYSHFVKTGPKERKAYILHYTLKLSGGEFSNGSLTVTVIDRGEYFGIFGLKLNGGA